MPSTKLKVRTYRFVRPSLYAADTQSTDMQGYYLRGTSPQDALQRVEDRRLAASLVQDPNWR